MEKSNLKIIRETDCEEMAIILKVTLENDVTLFVYEDGHAQGSDGKTLLSGDEGGYQSQR